MSPKGMKNAVDIHKAVPADWYTRSIKENILQRFWHTKRFLEVAKIIEGSGGKMLDVGCADGTFTKVIFDRAKPEKIVGIDVLSDSISFAKKKFAKKPGMSFRIANAHKLPFKNKEFDTVFCLEAMEHVEDPRLVISEIRRVLADDGYIVVLVPSENLFFRLGWPVWTATRGKVWRGTHLHRFSGDQIVSLIKKSGFRVVRNHKFILGMLQLVKARKK